MWQWVLLSILVLPLDLLLNLIIQVLIPVHHVHLPLLVSELQLILEHQLSVGFLLHGPLHVFILLSLLLSPGVPHLLSPLVQDVLLLVRSESLEVVGHVSVVGQLTHGSGGVLSHDVALIGVRDLEVVHSLLGVLPRGLLVALLLGQTLVLLLHLLHHVVALHIVLVFKHASHSVEG
jgi:hypothetical protein